MLADGLQGGDATDYLRDRRQDADQSLDAQAAA